MGKTEIVTASAFIVTADAIGAYTPNESFADISDLAGKTVQEILQAHAWVLRQRNDLLAERENLSVELGAAQHARVQAQRKLIDAKKAFKLSLEELSEIDPPAVAEAQSDAPAPASAPRRAPLVFTASNQMVLTFHNNGLIDGPNPGTPGWVEAMLELFEHDKEDQTVTWRWPEDENVVVIRNETLRDKDGSRWAYAYDIRSIGTGNWYCSDWSKEGTREHDNPMHTATHAYYRAVPLAK